MASLIFSRNINNGELGIDRIRQLAPAVFSTTHKDTLSSRYAPLHTADLIPVMSNYGFVPVQAAQVKGHKGSTEHKKHFVAFTHRDNLVDLYDDHKDMRGEIILYNSHDGTGSVQLFAGAYRFVCSNGIIAGDGFKNRVYHSRSGVAGFEEMLRSTVESLPLMMNKIKHLKSKVLSFDDSHTLAERAMQVRWDMAKQFAEDVPVRGSFATEQTLLDVKTVHRFADMGIDAWTVFNCIQDNVIRGKVFVKSFTDKHPEGVMRKARPINSVSENIRVNRELWNIVDEMVA